MFYVRQFYVTNVYLCIVCIGMGPLLNPADFLGEMKKESSGSREKDRKEEEKKSESMKKNFDCFPLFIPTYPYVI